MNDNDQLRLRDSMKDAEFDAVPDVPGVYQIVALDQTGAPCSICRARGQDSEGIMYLGQSKKNLRNRIWSFWQCATNEKATSHVAGWTYFKFHFAATFPVAQLMVRWESSKDSSSAESERKRLRDYFTRYLDKPPLNFAVSRWD